MMKRRLAVIFPLLVFFLLLPIAISHAQGQRQIMRAEYGVGQSWIDVTERVHSLIRANQLNFRVDNATLGLGDGSRARKSLRLDVRLPNGQTQRLTFRENQQVNLRNYSVAAVNGFAITRAVYGVGNRTMDVTRQLTSQIQGNQLDLQVTNQNMGGDPARDQEKTLTVWYNNNGRSGQVAIREGDYVTLPEGTRSTRNQRGFAITRAVYGVGNRTMDVTRRLTSQIQGNQLDLQVTNQNMGGDPARDQEKTLTVWYSSNGRSGQVTIREGDYITLPEGNRARFNRNENRLQIEAADYGYGNQQLNVIARLNSQIRNSRLNLQVTNETMGGDPARDQSKELSIRYKYDGRAGQITVREGEYLSLPQQYDQGAIYPNLRQ